MLLALGGVIAAAALYLSISSFEAHAESGTVRQVPWTLQQHSVKPGARAIRIAVTAGICDQGPDRFDHAQVRVTRSKIMVGAFEFFPPPKGDVCPAIAILVRAKVELPKSVGNRSIIDTSGNVRRWPPPAPNS